MEIIEFLSDEVLKHVYNEKYSKTEIDSTYDEFWLKYDSEKKYPTLKLLIVKKFTMFASTYVCESVFIKMNYIKKIPFPTHQRTPKNDDEDSDHKP